MARRSAAAALLAAVATIAGACDRGDPYRGAFQGIIEFEERLLGFEVAGRITSITARRGDPVRPGQTLAGLDDTLARTARMGRKAEVAAAAAREELVREGSRPEDIRAIEARVRAARASEQVARKDLGRDRALARAGAIPGAALDAAEARAKVATAEREALEQQLRELRRGARAQEIAGAKAQTTAAAAALELEAERLDQFQLTAERPGRILDVHVEPGEVVAAGTPVVTVADTEHPYVDVFVPVADLGGIRIGNDATARVDSTPVALAGTVEDISRRTEFTPRFVFSERERANLVVRVRVRIEDPDEVLHAGVPAFVTIARGAVAAGDAP